MISGVVEKAVLFIEVLLDLDVSHCFCCSCRATEWPFWFGHILPFCLIYIFNWVVFIAIMANLSRKKNPSQQKKQRIKLLKRNIPVAFGLSVLFGLGWGFGLTATSSSAKEVTFIFQVIFSVFVGAQGILIFILHGLRSQEARKVWRDLCICLSFKDKYNLSSSKEGKRSKSTTIPKIAVSIPHSPTLSEYTVHSTHPLSEMGSSSKSETLQ